MALKRPVTLDQARRWPAAANRRASFCARMGGMRRKLTGDQAAADPTSPINRALAAWDCDQAEGLKREHVSKGIRMARGITPAMVGSKAKAKARNPRARKIDKIDPFPSPLENYGPRKGLEGPFLMRNGRVVYYDPAEGAYYDPTNDFYLSAQESMALQGNPARKAAPKANPSAMLYTVHTATGEGKPRDPIAHFRKRADALAYAQAYAKTYGAPVVLTGKKL